MADMLHLILLPQLAQDLLGPSMLACCCMLLADVLACQDAMAPQQTQL